MRLQERTIKRQKCILELVEVSLLLLLPKVVTAGKTIWMVYQLGSEVGSAFAS